MKTDLATSIIAAIAGIVVAYFATNIVLPPLQDTSFKTLSAPIDAKLVDPDTEIFNFRAINPTVEVFVGECTEYDNSGKCIDDNYKAPEESEEMTPDEEENGDTD